MIKKKQKIRLYLLLSVLINCVFLSHILISGVFIFQGWTSLASGATKLASITSEKVRPVLLLKGMVQHLAKLVSTCCIHRFPL